MMYYHTDILGSVVAITTSAGAIGRMFTYDAFGRVYTYGYQSGVPRPFPLETFSTNLYSNTRYYTGREYDLQRNVYSLYYHRARYYDPKIGRFLSRDPIGQNDQVNLYAYVRNSPLMYTDRDGKKVSTDKLFTLKNENKIICNDTKLRYTFPVKICYEGDKPSKEKDPL